MCINSSSGGNAPRIVELLHFICSQKAVITTSVCIAATKLAFKQGLAWPHLILDNGCTLIAAYAVLWWSLTNQASNGMNHLSDFLTVMRIVYLSWWLP